jgi:hypothetical protein
VGFVIQYRSEPEVLRDRLLPICVRAKQPNDG